MIQLLQTGNTANTPVKQYYVDSEEEIAKIPNNAPTGSTVLILTEKGLSVKMKKSDGTWVAI